jgi:hypothetical protein
MNAKDGLFVAGACVLGAFAGSFGSRWITGGEAWAQARSLRTQQVVLVDPAGRNRAAFHSAASGQPVLVFFDASNNVRFGMSLEGREDSPLVNFYGSGGHPLITLGLNPDDTGAIVLSDKANKLRGALEVGRDGHFRIVRADADGKTTHRWP